MGLPIDLEEYSDINKEHLINKEVYNKTDNKIDEKIYLKQLSLNNKPQVVRLKLIKL